MTPSSNPTPETRTVAVLMAVHNRRDLSVAAVERLVEIAPPHWRLVFYVVDDGSTDGTYEALTELPHQMRIIRGSGDWFWSRSMAAAEAQIDQQVDDVLWANDDIRLYDDALATLDRWRQLFPQCLLMGQFCDPVSGEPSFVGSMRTGRYALSSRTATALDTPRVVDLAAANLLLVPAPATAEIGPIDGRYAHGHADYDYSLRAKTAGYPTIAVPGFVGTATRNPQIQARSVRESFRFLNSRMGLPPHDRMRFLRSHGGRIGVLQFPLPYIAAMLGRRPSIRRPNPGSSAEATFDGD